ncbi:Hypothetical predicted protein, partial [Pelobates cultripes]
MPHEKPLREGHGIHVSKANQHLEVDGGPDPTGGVKPLQQDLPCGTALPRPGLHAGRNNRPHTNDATQNGAHGGSH